MAQTKNTESINATAITFKHRGNKMSNKVEKFLDLLCMADIVMVDDGPMLTSWETAPIEGNPDNEVVRISWEDDGYTYTAILTEEGIDGAKYDPAQKAFFLKDNEGEETKLNFGKYKSVDVASEDWQ